MTTSFADISYRQARDTLDDKSVRCSYLASAINLAAQSQATPGTTTNVLFTKLESTRAQFSLFADEDCLFLLACAYDPDGDDPVRLFATDRMGAELAGGEVPEGLVSAISSALAQLEGQIWSRVSSADGA